MGLHNFRARPKLYRNGYYLGRHGGEFYSLYLPGNRDEYALYGYVLPRKFILRMRDTLFRIVHRLALRF